jgi:hypothetical protein
MKVKYAERYLIQKKSVGQMCMCIAIGLLIEWTISGHVKSFLWMLTSKVTVFGNTWEVGKPKRHFYGYSRKASL